MYGSAALVRAPNSEPSSTIHKLTAPDIKTRKVYTAHEKKHQVKKISAITAYDFTMAKLVDESGIDITLVGDSLGMVAQGESNTLFVSVDDMVYHTRIVSKGLAHSHLTSDMPFGSYHEGPRHALKNAVRLVKEGRAESVKIEGGARVVPHIKLIVQAGIPVMGHIGLTPQSIHMFGGFKMQGRGEQAAKLILDDALALQDAGVFCVVLEAIPPDLAEQITRALSIPTIGIGAGAVCDGQILVYSDLLGLCRGDSPRFVKRYANLAPVIVEAFQTYIDEIEKGTFPDKEHIFKANKL